MPSGEHKTTQEIAALKPQAVNMLAPRPGSRFSNNSEERRQALSAIVGRTLSKEFSQVEWDKILGASEVGREMEKDGSAHALGVAVLMHLSDVVGQLAGPLQRCFQNPRTHVKTKALAFDRLKEIIDRGIKIGAALASLPASGAAYWDERNPKINPSFVRGQQVSPVNLQFNVNTPTVQNHESTMGPQSSAGNLTSQPPDQPAVGAQTS